MSELIAEARVLVTPDTTAFRGLLATQLAGITKSIPPIPVVVSPVVSGTATTGALVAEQAALGTEVAGTTAALNTEAVALNRVQKETAEGAAASRIAASASQQQAAATAKHAAQLAQFSRGASSAGAAMVGLRGATLAASGPFLAAAVSLAAFAASAKLSAGLETSLNVFNVTAEATAEEMEQVSQLARQLGRDLTLPGVTAGGAADALSGLARAGLSVEDAMAGVRGTLQLATAAAIDNETAVLLVAGALNAFALDGTEAAHVADLLASSSKQSQGSIEDMGLALQQAAAAAAQAGISVEDTVAILTQLGRAGLRGSDAGTSFRTAILRIINPSKEAQAAIQGLGVTLRDLDGNIRPEVFAEIATQAAKLGPAARDATIALIGGQDAFRALSILGRDGAAGLRDMRAATDEAGAAAELASARTKGLAGAGENLKNQFGALGLTIGDAVNEPLADIANNSAAAVSGLNSFFQFLGSLNNEATATEQALGDLERRAALKALQQGTGAAGAAEELERLKEEGALVSQQYVNMVKRAGEFNQATAALKGVGGPELEALRILQAQANKELEDSVPAALAAREGIEGYAQGVRDAAAAVEGLVNRIDESQDRFTQPLPTPQAPPGPDRKRVSQLQGQVALAQSEGDIREVERIQEQILANAVRAEREGIHKGIEARQKLFDERVAAESALNNTRKQIADKGLADAKATATDVARKKLEADEAFLQTQEDARTRQERRVTVAEDTPGLRDDIRRQRENRVLITQQIDDLKKSSVDEKTKQQAIRALRIERDKTTDAINDLKRTDAEQRAAAKEQQNEERIALGQSIFDLTGNKNPLLRALNAEIARTQKQINAAKKAGKSTVALRTELNKLLLQKKNLNEEADSADKDSVGGTSLADLFKRAKDIVSGAGNVGFDAAGLQGLSANREIKMQVQQRLDIVNDPAKAREARQQASTDRLIAAIDQLTDAITGNSTTGSVREGPQNGRQWRALTQEQRFYYQRTAKQMVEQGLVG